jgi:hypothetical protein
MIFVATKIDEHRLRLYFVVDEAVHKRQIHQSVTKESLGSDRASDIDLTFRSKSTLAAVRRCRFRKRKGAKCHELLPYLLTLAVFPVTGFVLLVLIGARAARVSRLRNNSVN